MARTEGFLVEIVIVGDDCALIGTDSAGRRGLAGTVLVHKIAGAAAESGLSLTEVTRIAKNIATSMYNLCKYLEIIHIISQMLEQLVWVFPLVLFHLPESLLLNLEYDFLFSFFPE